MNDIKGYFSRYIINTLLLEKIKYKKQHILESTSTTYYDLCFRGHTVIFEPSNLHTLTRLFGYKSWFGDAQLINEINGSSMM